MERMKASYDVGYEMMDDEDFLAFIKDKLKSGLTREIVDMLDYGPEYIIKLAGERVFDYSPTHSKRVVAEIDMDRLVHCKECTYEDGCHIKDLLLKPNGYCSEGKLKEEAE